MQLQTKVITATPPARKLGTAKSGQKVHMQVINHSVAAGDVKLLFANDRETLEAQVGFLPQSGYEIDDTSGLVEIQWEGDLWAIGASANPADVQLRFGVD